MNSLTALLLLSPSIFLFDEILKKTRNRPASFLSELLCQSLKLSFDSEIQALFLAHNEPRNISLGSLGKHLNE